MISYLLRRRCGNCRVALYGVCHTHHERAKVYRRWVKVIGLMLAMEALNLLVWRYFGRRWTP